MIQTNQIGQPIRPPLKKKDRPKEPFQPGPVRQAYDTVAKWAGGAVGGVLAAPAGAFTGAAAGLGQHFKSEVPAEELAGLHLGAQAITDAIVTLAGAGYAAAAANAVAGTGGAIGAGLGGTLAGAGLTILHNSLENSQKISQVIATGVEQAIANVPASDSAIRDGFRAITVGGLKGAVLGVKPAAQQGAQQMLGLAEGLWEGTAQGGKTLLGGYDLPTSPTPEEPISWGRKATHVAFGAAGAVFGSAFTTTDGIIQGSITAAAGPDNYTVSPAVHTAVVQTQAGLASAIGMALAFGPVGFVVGAVAGGFLARGIARFEQKTGIDKEVALRVQHSVDSALANSPDLGNDQSNTFRNAVEGGMVGGAAGARNGARYGYECGKGAADGLIAAGGGVVDAAVGVYEALKEIITGKPDQK